MKTNLWIAAVGAAVLALAGPVSAATQQLLNVSYDPTRELYQDINRAFAKRWAAEGGGAVQFRQSRGGSGKQARAVEFPRRVGLCAAQYGSTAKARSS